MTRLALARLVLLFISLDVALACLLAWKATRPRPIVVVPGAPREIPLEPGEPTEAAMRQFAVYFAVNMENFTPATFEAQAALVRRLVSPGCELEATLRERARLASEAGLGSSLFVNPTSILVTAAGALHEVRFRATRRQYVGCRLSWEAPFEYRIGLECVPPTVGNPHGVAVRHLHARKVNDEGPTSP